jgi:hypothetical protein
MQHNLLWIKKSSLRLVFLHELKIEVLLFGNDTLTEMQNLQIFKSVQLYITPTYTAWIISQMHTKKISIQATGAMSQSKCELYLLFYIQQCKIWGVLLYDFYLLVAKSANFQICTTLHQTNKTFYPFMITTLPPTPFQIYIC